MELKFKKRSMTGYRVKEQEIVATETGLVIANPGDWVVSFKDNSQRVYPKEEFYQLFTSKHSNQPLP